MDQNKITCACGQQFLEEEFGKHFGVCQPFKQQFKEFDSKFGELLKSYSEPKERLLIVKFLLKQYITVIDKKLKKYFASLGQNQSQPSFQDGNVPPSIGGIGAPPGMGINMGGSSQNQYKAGNSQLFSNSNPSPNMMNQNPYSNNNPYKQNNQNQGNPYQNQNQGNPYQNQNQGNPYQNQNQGNPYQNQNQGNPYQNQNQSNPYQNQNQSNPYQNQNQNDNPYKQSQKQNDNPYKQSQNQNPYKQSSNPFSQPNIENNNNNDFENDFSSQPIQQNDNIGTMCQICKTNPDVVYLSCVHPICNKCFVKYAEEKFYEMKCNICQKTIDDQTKLLILGEQKKTELENKALMGIIGANLVKCPYKNCGEQNEFEPGQVDYKVRDEHNQIISRQAAEDYAKNRCRCGYCKKDFCKGCLAMPYHLGKTCEEFKRLQSAKKCRFCDSEIKGLNRGPDDDVCNDKECRDRYIISCKKRLPCGHKCFGVDGELQCPPCIDKECNQFGGQFGQNKDDYCIICYSEGLGSSPLVVLSCGHYMHYLCLKKRLETKWIGPKITFNHCLCPSCNKWFDCNSVPELQKMIDENKKLFEEIKEMSLKRLKFEDLDKDPRLTDPNSPWYGKKVEFALKRLSYYMCYVCKKPYFAGRRECGNDPNMNNDDPNKNYDPKDCVCGKDANLSGVAGKTNCPKHGKDFIEYKCKFCCKIASWFCWGTTHFCEDCHKRQCNNDYVSKYPKDKLPKCNKATCEVGGNHPPNGEEYALGCSICRNNEENVKDF